MALSDAPVRRPVTNVQVLAVVAGVDDATAHQRPDRLVTEEPLEIRVSGPGQEPEPFVVTSTIQDGDELRDTMAWKAEVTGATADHVEFWIDDKLVWTERTAPYGFKGDDGSFDPREYLEKGREHTLVVKAYSTDGRTARYEATVKAVGP